MCLHNAVVLPPTPLQNVLLSKCLQPCDSASNVIVKRSVLYLFINLRCAESVCLYYGLRVCGQKYIITTDFHHLYIIIRHLQAKITNFISFKHVFGPRIVPKVDEFIFHAICNILEWNNKRIFHQINVCVENFRKVQHKLLMKPSKVLNNFRCYINNHFINSSCGTISNIAKFIARAFRFQLSNFSTNALRIPCGCRLTLFSCWNMSARYAMRKINGYFLDWIPFRFFLPHWEFILIHVPLSCILHKACIWAYYYAY